uniref:hypothetical protein n=1 Tax=Dyadobacter sp. TaxID=1914288 RepID=UPI003F70621E
KAPAGLPVYRKLDAVEGLGSCGASLPDLMRDKQEAPQEPGARLNTGFFYKQGAPREPHRGCSVTFL